MGILDGDYDPLANIGRLPTLGGASASQRPAYRSPLPPEQLKSVGQQALDTGASGLNYALGTLDKPGQAVRGVLAGHGLSSLKHLVPFSDSVGLTNEADHVSGRDLTDQYGLTRKTDKGWGAWGAGLAADIATDPLSYATLGPKHAFTAIGDAVKKTGALKGMSGRALLEGFQGTEKGLAAAGNSASDITHLIDQGKRIATGAADATGVQAGQPLSSLVRLGLPFGGPGVNIGTGLRSQKIAGALDRAGDWAKFGNPVGRALGSMFDSSLYGATDKITQQGAQKYKAPAMQALQADARNDFGGVVKGLSPIVSGSGFPEHEVTDAARAIAEGVPHQFDPALASQVAPTGQKVKDIGERRLAEAQAAGAPLNDLSDDYRSYVHRSLLPENSKNLQLGTSKTGMLPVTSGSNISVQELYRDIPGGTNRLQDWFRRFSSHADPVGTAATIEAEMAHDLARGGNAMTPELQQQFSDKAAALSSKLAATSPERLATATNPGGLYSPDLASDIAQGGAQHAATVSNAKTVIGILGDNAQQIGKNSDLVPISKVMRQLGLKTRLADAAAGTPMEGALVQAYKALAKQGAGKVDPFLMGQIGPLKKAVDQFGLTPEHVSQLTKSYGKWAAPEQIKSSVGALDSFTNAFKALAYPMWIPAHVRNAMTAGVNNATRGVGVGDYLDQLRTMTGRGARDLSGIHPSLVGLSPSAQVDKLREMQYTGANIFGGHGMNEEIAGNASQAIQQGKRFTPNVPGSDRVGPTGNLAGDTLNLVGKEGLLGSLGAGYRTARDSIGGLLNPNRAWGQSIGENLGVRGVGGAAKDTLPAVAAGRKAGTNIEDFFRGAQFNRELRNGATPEVASDAIDRLHFNYDALSGFEKNVMRRAVPFYTFMKKNLPLQLDTALHTPGIINAQYKPFSQPEPGGKGYVPKYLSGGVSVPLGPEQGGKRQYISKLGLPAEEAFERLHFKNGLPDIPATAMDYMGSMNPLIKAPLEQMTNTQFHTGRKLSDLKAGGAAGTIGKMFGDDNPQALGQIMANSPFTRFFSSADKLMDPRKSWGQKLLNLGTGVRVTDVDTDKQRAIDTRSALESIMGTHPNLSRYSSFYVRPEDAKDLTPEEIEMMRAYSAIQENAKAYAKQQKERIGVR